MFRLRSIIALTICVLVMGLVGPAASSAMADDVDPALETELPPDKGGPYSAEDGGDPDDYGITIPPDLLPEPSPTETVDESIWSWRALVAWLSEVVSLRN